MKKALILLVILFFTQSAYSQWNTRQLPTPRTHMAGAYADGKVFFTGGLSQISPQNVASAVVDIYDIYTGYWTVAALSSPRSYVAAVASGSKVLFAGGVTITPGGNAENSNVMDIYDIPTFSWSQVTLPFPGSELTTAAIGDKVYFAKGSSFGFDDIWVYDLISGSWSTLEIPGGHRKQLTLVAVGAKLVFAGGIDSNNQPSALINIYDTGTSTWSMKMLSEPRHAMRAVTLGTSCYFTGGLKGISTSNAMDIYDDGTGEVTSKTMPAWRFNHAVGTHDGEIMIGSHGELTSNGGAVDIYYPQTDTWSPPFSYFFPDFTKHADMTAVSTPVGVFFGGGINGQAGTLEDEVFILSNTVAANEPATQALKISPTIADNMLNISLPDNIAEDLDIKTISVIDLSGKTLLVKANTTSRNSWNVQLPSMPSGSYIIRMECGDRTLTGRFIKQ